MSEHTVDSQFYMNTAQRGLVGELTMYYPGANSRHIRRDCSSRDSAQLHTWLFRHLWSGSCYASSAAEAPQSM